MKNLISKRGGRLGQFADLTGRLGQKEGGCVFEGVMMHSIGMKGL